MEIDTSLTLKQRFSQKNITKELKKRIEKYYEGKKTKPKLALLKVTDNYNDEEMNYEGDLIIVDEKYDEVDHNIDISDLIPDYDEERAYCDEYGDYPQLDNITIKF